MDLYERILKDYLLTNEKLKESEYKRIALEQKYKQLEDDFKNLAKKYLLLRRVKR